MTYSARVLRRRLDGVGMQPHAPRRSAGVVHAGFVVHLHDASLGERVGQAAQHAGEGIDARCVGEGIGRLVQLLGQHGRQHLRQLHEGSDDLGIELVGGLGQQARGQEEGHRLVGRQCQRWQEGIGIKAELAAVIPDGQAGIEVHGLQVAVDGSPRDADLLGERRPRRCRSRRGRAVPGRS